MTDFDKIIKFFEKNNKILILFVKIRQKSIMDVFPDFFLSIKKI
jgi:hypothetical protein